MVERDEYGTFASDGAAPQTKSSRAVPARAVLIVCAVVATALLVAVGLDSVLTANRTGGVHVTEPSTSSRPNVASVHQSMKKTAGTSTAEERVFTVNLREDEQLQQYFTKNVNTWPASQVLPEQLQFTVRDDLVMGDMGEQMLEGYDIIALNTGVFLTDQITSVVLLVVDLDGNVVNTFVPNNEIVTVNGTDFMAHVESIHMVTPTSAIFMQKGVSGVVWLWDVLTDTTSKYYASGCNGHDAQLLLRTQELHCVTNNGLIVYDMEGASPGDTLKQKSKWLISDSYTALAEETGIHDYELRTDPHWNRVTFNHETKTAYLSSRNDNSVIKLDLATETIEWVLGGVENQFTVYDIDGTVVDSSLKDELFYGQHNVEVRSDGKIVMFNNNRNPISTAEFGSGSELLILSLDEDNMEAKCTWKYELGFYANIYGDADILVGGNILGTAWPDTIYPLTLADQADATNTVKAPRKHSSVQDTSTTTVHDYSAPTKWQAFETNWFEVTSTGETAMHIGLVARMESEDDPSAEVEDGQVDVLSSHYTLSDDDGGISRAFHETPAGYAAYSVVRFYTAPLSGHFQVSDDRNVLSLDVFNAHRTTIRAAGLVALDYYETASDVSSAVQLDSVSFQFGALWVAETVSLSLEGLTSEMEASICDGSATLSVQVENIDFASAFNSVASVVLCDGALSSVSHSKRANENYHGSVKDTFTH